MEEATAGLLSGLDFILYPTPQLEAIVEQYRRAFSEEQFLRLLETMRTVFERSYRRLAVYERGADRAREAHRLVEEAFAESFGIHPSCSRGCSACCHLEVEITEDEGELLAERVRKGVAIDHQRLERQAARPRRSAEWRAMMSDENLCIFLDEGGACRVYDDRPSICRKHVVSSPPFECASPDGAPVAIPIPLAELAVSAALSQPSNRYASLSKMVKRGLEESSAERAPYTSETVPVEAEKSEPSIVDSVPLYTIRRRDRAGA